LSNRRKTKQPSSTKKKTQVGIVKRFLSLEHGKAVERTKARAEGHAKLGVYQNLCLDLGKQKTEGRPDGQKQNQKAPKGFGGQGLTTATLNWWGGDTGHGGHKERGGKKCQ